jgi:hypothetical protein
MGLRPAGSSARGSVGRAGFLVLLAACAALLPLSLVGRIGSPLLRLEAPRAGEVVGPTGLDVMVRFTDAARVAPETFRVLLNGADVTESFTTGENGSVGRLHSLLDGENRVRAEVFGRSRLVPWLLVEEADEISVVHRRPLDLDRG